MGAEQFFPRSSGVLLHITSLPGPWGIGDLGPSAYHFVDWLASAGQSYWQTLPVGPTGYGDSPYALLSLFGGNPLLVSIERLISDGLLPKAARSRSEPKPDERRVDFGSVISTRTALLRRAVEAFHRDASHSDRERFEVFAEEQSSWLDTYCRFMALKEENEGQTWSDWKRKQPKEEALEFYRVVQYWFHQQWRDLRAYAHRKSIQLIGDVPIYPAYDSADVWGHPKYYQVDDADRPVAVAGVPPDYFSPTGQLWGNPVYDWDALWRDGFDWWIRRVRYLGELFDVLRLDHFRGFAAYWRVPAGQPTAQNGEWVRAPGHEMFESLIRAGAVRSEDSESGVQIIVEDLGLITEDVHDLRDRFGFPGMRVLEFGFDGDAQNLHLPHSYPHHLVAYTSTHDNDTILGWYAALDEPSQKLAAWYVGDRPSQWNFLRYVAGSCAQLALYPLQDVLGLGSDARMNFPGRNIGNWTWRFTWDDVAMEAGDRLKLMTERYARGRKDESVTPFRS